jgi:hypothetical protein
VIGRSIRMEGGSGRGHVGHFVIVGRLGFCSLSLPVHSSGPNACFAKIKHATRRIIISHYPSLL